MFGGSGRMRSGRRRSGVGDGLMYRVLLLASWQGVWPVKSHEAQRTTPVSVARV